MPAVELNIIRVTKAGQHLAEEPEEACPSTKNTWVHWAWVNPVLGVSPDIKPWYNLLEFGRRINKPTL